MYSTFGCQGSIGGGFRASWTSSEVKPSPKDELDACFVGEEDVVGEKKA
jgi:hypothetical protein